MCSCMCMHMWKPDTNLTSFLQLLTMLFGGGGLGGTGSVSETKLSDSASVADKEGPRDPPLSASPFLSAGMISTPPTSTFSRGF